jgi:hypothetical protein
MFGEKTYACTNEKTENGQRRSNNDGIGKPVILRSRFSVLRFSFLLGRNTAGPHAFAVSGRGNQVWTGSAKAWHAAAFNTRLQVFASVIPPGSPTPENDHFPSACA